MKRLVFEAAEPDVFGRIAAASLNDREAVPKIVLAGVTYRIEDEVVYEGGFYFVLGLPPSLNG